MNNLVALPLVAILLAGLQLSHGLTSVAPSTTHGRVGVVSKSQLFVASTQLEISASDSDTSDGDVVEDIEFPPPLSSWDRTKRAATFYSTAIPIVANYYGLIGNLKIQELLGTERFTEEEIEVCVLV